MMKSNYLRLANVARVAKYFGASLRVNVYQAVRSDIYALTYEEYWQGFRRLFEETDVIAICPWCGRWLGCRHSKEGVESARCALRRAPQRSHAYIGRVPENHSRAWFRRGPQL
jgi:N-glycosylase/DNA lyase